MEASLRLQPTFINEVIQTTPITESQWVFHILLDEPSGLTLSQRVKT